MNPQPQSSFKRHPIRARVICRLIILCGMVTATGVRAGSIDWEQWSFISGDSVQSLIDSGALDLTADYVDVITERFDTFTVFGEDENGSDYGSRIRGFIQVPETGDYTLFLRSDDASQMFFNAGGHDPAGAELVAEEVESGGGLFSGDRIEQRTAGPFNLEKGKSYYIKILHKESGGADYVEVGWQRPDGTREIIPGLYLQAWAPDDTEPSIEEEPAELEVIEGNPAAISVTVRVAQPATFQWRKDGKPIDGAVNQALVIPVATAGDAGSYSVVITGPDGSTTSDEAELVVVPDTSPPTVVRAELNANGAELNLVFSEIVTEASAADILNYLLNNDVVVTGAQFGADGRSVTLPTSELAPGSKDYTLTIKGVQDVSNNILAETTVPVMLTITETFDASLGVFDAKQNNREMGNDFGFSNTNNAGGEPGELGGLIQRRTTGNAAYVAASNLGGTLTLENDLIIRGKMQFINQNMDGHLYFGYVPGLDALTKEVLGMDFAEPNGDSGPAAFRGFLMNQDLGSPLFPWPNEEQVNFEIFWSAADGVLTANVNGEEFSLEIAAPEGEYTVFAIGAWNASDRSDGTQWFWDDLTFSVVAVPEPPGPVVVAITQPKKGRRFRAGSEVTISAAAAANEGNLTKVEFFASVNGADPEKIGEATSAPFSVVLTGIAEGEYTFTATASNDKGDTATSKESSINVFVVKSVTTSTETFDEGLGEFDTEFGNRDIDFYKDFGFSESNNAGGEPGELGGLLSRTTNTDFAYVGNTDLGGLLSPPIHNLTLKGKLIFTDVSFDGNAYFGYVDTGNLNNFMGIVVTEPGGGFAPDFRISVRAPGGSSPTFGLAGGAQHEFDLNWDANTGTMTGSLGGVAINFEANAGDALFNALILGAFGGASTRNDQVDMYVDNLTYTVIGVPSHTETFDVDLGAFDGAVNNSANGNDFGFLDSDNAAGAAGEAGGLFARTSTADAAYIGDITIGRLSMKDELKLSGKILISDIGFDGGLFVGYADLGNLDNRLGLDISEPGGDVAPNFRARARVNGDDSDLVPLPPDVAIEFELSWDPDTLTLSGTIAGQSVEIVGQPGDASYDSFIMGALGVGSSRPGDQAKFYLDEVTYNLIPTSVSAKITEPVAGTLIEEGDTVVVSAYAATTQGNIALVEFFVVPEGGEAEKIGEASAEPYSVNWTPGAGNYRLSVAATNADGLSVVSGEITVSVVAILEPSLFTETFTEGLGAFNTEVGNRDFDNFGKDFGFSDTNNAGSDPGELGGVLSRTTNADAAYVGVTNLGGLLVPSRHNQVLKGKFIINDLSFDGNMYFGYVDTSDLGRFMGIRFSEPGGGFQPDFRGSVQAPGGNSDTFGIEGGVLHEFDLFWEAASGTMTGTLAGVDINFSADVGTATFDAIVLGAFGGGSTRPGDQVEFFVDDVTYSSLLLPTVTETFDTGLGIFDGAQNNQANGNDFGFSETNNAGAAAGEAGGLFARTATDEGAYIGDVTIGLRNMRENLMLSGRILISDISFDGGLFIGYADLANLNNRIGLDLAEPGGDVEPNFRARARVNGEDSDLVPLPPDQAVEFQLNWDPDTLTLSGTVGGESLQVTGEPGAVTYDAFIMGALGTGSSRPGDQAMFYLDDVTYNSRPVNVSVSITQPLDGTVINEGETMVVSAGAEAIEGNIQRVDFFAQEPPQEALILLGESTTAPYQVEWSPAAGNYRIWATATDDAGSSSDSREVGVFVVSERPPTLVTETFTGGLGAFGTEVSNRDPDNGKDFGYSETSNAGGDPGELGGVLSRTTNDDAAIVGATNLGGALLPAIHDIRLSGRFILNDIAFDGDMYFGYVNTSNWDEFMGLRVNEPGGDFAPNFRGSVRAPGGDSDTFGIEGGVVHEFDLNWEAASGTMTGTLAGVDINFTADVGTAAFDSLVLGAFGAGSTRPADQVEFFVDDVTFTTLLLPTITETFDTGPGAFDGGQNADANGNMLGFSDTNNAGGQAGEAGGVFARTPTDQASYIGDLTLGGRLSQTDPLVLKGRLVLSDIDFDGGIFLGYADTANLDNRIGIDIAEPGGDFRPNFRVRLTANGDQGERIGVASNAPVEFNLSWDPDTGTLSGTIGDQEVTVTAGPGAASYDALIFGAMGAGSSDPPRIANAFVDDLTYNVVPAEEGALLTIQQSNGNVVISWTGEGFTPQERDTLDDGDWSDSQATIVQDGAGFSAAVTPTGTSRFWRLSK